MKIVILSGNTPNPGDLRPGKKLHLPVVWLCGQNNLTTDPGFEKAFPVVPVKASLAESMPPPGFCLRRMIRKEVIPCIDNLNPNIKSKIK